MIVETIQYSISFTIHVNAAGTFLAICRVITAFCDDFAQSVGDFDEKIQKMADNSPGSRRIDLKLSLRQLIQLHYDIKRSVVPYFNLKRLCLIHIR